ncbi:MAG: hypothetical protein ABFD54_04540 [Armatimonadota bacterium]
MKTIPIDRATLIKRMNAAFTCVEYDLNAKPRLGSLPGTSFTTSDCSGFVRWILYAASGGKIKLKTGSWYQQQWCREQGFKEVKYSDVAGLHDSRLRIAFINGANGAGHVWLIINGQTIECYGGHGAGRRPWNTSVLLRKVDACFVLTDVLP